MTTPTDNTTGHDAGTALRALQTVLRADLAQAREDNEPGRAAGISDALFRVAYSISEHPRERSESTADGWAVRHPDGTIEQAGIRGENRARMVARSTGGVVIEPTATLATVGDIAFRGSEGWSDHRVMVRIVNGYIGWQVSIRDGVGGALVCEASNYVPLPSSVLTDAIRAARGEV